jgi:hypothetical protein
MGRLEASTARGQAAGRSRARSQRSWQGGSASPIAGAARALATALLVSTNGAAQGLPPWVAPGRVPLSEDVRSAEILRRDEPLYVAPSAAAARRGSGRRGARLPVYGAEPGPGCRGDWLLVGPTAWVCSATVGISAERPDPVGARAGPTADGLPTDYYFVGSDGVLGYAALSSAEQTAPVAELQPGFAVSVIETRAGPSGEPFGVTSKGLWLPVRDLRRIHPLVFRGYDVASGALDRGWVIVDVPSLYDSPGGHRLGPSSLRRFDTVRVLEASTAKGRPWVRVAEGWLDGADARVPAAASPPPEVRQGEHWLDVDLGRQIVTAYEGERAVFATLASTGVGKGEDLTATPVGVHRVWVKLQTTDMTNLEEADASRYYAIEEVPWVLFFKKGYGFHGAFWHQGFGTVRSHGCVNLTPLDAKRLFDWASPHLPDGWTAVLPTDYDPGTLVRVR